MLKTYSIRTWHGRVGEYTREELRLMPCVCNGELLIIDCRADCGLETMVLKCCKCGEKYYAHEIPSKHTAKQDDMAIEGFKVILKTKQQEVEFWRMRARKAEEALEVLDKGILDVLDNECYPVKSITVTGNDFYAINTEELRS